MKLTKFEEDLKAFFPDIYALNEHGKFDQFFWEAVNALHAMRKMDETGEINIHFVGGKIDKLYKKTNLTAFSSHKPNLSRPNEQDD